MCNTQVHVQSKSSVVHSKFAHDASKIALVFISNCKLHAASPYQCKQPRSWLIAFLPEAQMHVQMLALTGQRVVSESSACDRESSHSRASDLALALQCVASDCMLLGRTVFEQRSLRTFPLRTAWRCNPSLRRISVQYHMPRQPF